MKLTRLQFRQRFTDAERVAIEFAAVDNPAASQAQRLNSAKLRVYLADIAVAEHVDLTRPDTQAGVQALEQLGLLAPGRAAQILELPGSEWPPVGGYVLGQLVRVKPPFSAIHPGQYPVIGFGPNCVELEMGQFDLSLVEPV